jgi:hypothetical protein
VFDIPNNEYRPGELTLEAVGLGSPQPRARTSEARFPDGGAYRVEIPSVEGPEPLVAVLDEAATRGLVIHRVSQGSGVMLLSDAEIETMVSSCGAAGVELCLFLGPRASWDIGGGRASRSGGGGTRARGRDQLAQSLADAERAVELGVRCLLVADEGVLWLLHELRAAGHLPADLTLKVSALSGPLNPASFALQERLGADSVNVAADLTLAQVAELRAAARVPIDFYVEAPDDLGGFVRHYDVPELVRLAAPIYLKFGVRNAPDLYPVGEHLRDVAIATGRERVRRADLALAHLARAGVELAASPRAARTPPAGLHRFPAGELRPTMLERAAPGGS